MELIDTHCHLDVAAFDVDRQQVMSRCRQQGINQIIVPAIHQPGWQGLLRLCQQEPGLYPALGLHPVYIEQHTDSDVQALQEQLALHHPIAVGEIGLDYFVADLDRQRQQRFFEAQLHCAQQADLPVILHVRKSHDQVLAALRRIKVKGGVCHAFNGSLQQAQQYIDMGFKLGFGGTLTYDRSHKIRQLAGELPLTAIVLETDAPDMVVSAHRGERNSPEYLTDCLSALAEVRDMSEQEVAEQTTMNAREVFMLDKVQDQ